MTKETLKSIGKTTLVTLAGAGEGALIGAQWTLALGPMISIPLGAAAGGTTALAAELRMQAKQRATSAPSTEVPVETQESVGPVSQPEAV